MQIYKNLSLSDLPDELWKQVSGYENRYLVSNMGRIKSLSKPITLFNGGKYKTRERVLAQRLSDGYLFVALFSGENKDRLDIQAHIIVGKEWVPNPDSKPEINHKKGVKTDNRAIELEWSTRSENIQHAYDTGLLIHSNTGKSGLDANYSKPVQCTATGMVMNIKDAAIFTGVSNTHMSSMMNGKRSNWTTFINL